MHFDVRALNADGGVVNVPLEALDRGAALEIAQAQGLVVLSAKPRRGFVPSKRLLAPRFQLLTFTQELVALLRAGLSLPETLETMTDKESRPEIRQVLLALRDSLYEGRALSQALSLQPAIFSPLYVATVRAAERTGGLPESLARYIEYHQRLDQVRKKVVSAAIYPAVLLVVGAMVTVFLMAYVVPRFSLIYAESGRELPLMSRLLLDWGQLMNAHGAFMLGAMLACAVLAAVLFKPLRAALGALVVRIPAIGSRVLMYHLARFYRTLSMLLRGGTPVVPALLMVGGLLPPDLRNRLATATQRVRDGASLSDAMAGAGLSTPVASRMLRVGESSGDMAAMMERIASFHDDELARWIDWFTKLFEPLLMALIGVVIGGIVILMYMPIFDLAGSLQ